MPGPAPRRAQGARAPDAARRDNRALPSRAIVSKRRSRLCGATLALHRLRIRKQLFGSLFRLRLGGLGRHLALHLLLLGEFLRRRARAAMHRLLEVTAALPLCDVVIAAREITHGSVEIPIGGAIGAGEVF